MVLRIADKLWAVKFPLRCGKGNSLPGVTIAMRISMVMAMDRNKLVGDKGVMPWKIPSDLKYFKQLTMGKPLIMGRVTFESLGGVLPGRPHIVITRNPDWMHKGLSLIHI